MTSPSGSFYAARPSTRRRSQRRSSSVPPISSTASSSRRRSSSAPPVFDFTPSASSSPLTLPSSQPTPPSTPTIWRNGSLKCRNRRAPRLQSFAHNVQGTRFTEDFDSEAYGEAAGIQRTPSPLTLAESSHRPGNAVHSRRCPSYAPPPPRAAPLRERDPSARALYNQIVETSHYPIERLYERSQLVRMLDLWIANLQVLHLNCTQYLQELFGWLQRGMQLGAYRIFLARLEELTTSVDEMQQALKQASRYDQTHCSSECRELDRLLPQWIWRATEAFAEMAPKKTTRNSKAREEEPWLHGLMRRTRGRPGEGDTLDPKKERKQRKRAMLAMRTAVVALTAEIAGSAGRHKDENHEQANLKDLAQAVNTKLAPEGFRMA